MVTFDRKLSLVDIALVFIWFFIVALLVVKSTECNRKSTYIDWLVRDNYVNVAKSLLDYNSQNNTFPIHNNWQQNLINNYSYLNRNNFMGFNRRIGDCVVLNKDLSNGLYATNMVIIFSGVSEPEFIGGKEILWNYIEKYSEGWFINSNLEYFAYDSNTDKFVNSEDGKKISFDEICFIP